MVALRSWYAFLAFVVCVSVPVSVAPEPLPRTTAPLATLYAVGDIMYRGTADGAAAVGQLMESLLALDPANSRAILAGDVCNDGGERECYERLEETPWGPLRPLVYAVPGNHDYEDATRTGRLPYFFNYLINRGEPQRGWHAFDWGGWRVLGLNTEIMAQDVQNRLSPLGHEQMAWMERELRRHSRDRCVLTYYHRPMYSSGRFGSPAWAGAIYRKAYKHGVDLYFAAHEHMFAALPPLAPFRDDATGVGAVDRVYGVPGLIGGTGGASFFPDPRQDRALRPADRRLKWALHGEIVLSDTWGVTRIDLWPGGYQWRFIPVRAVPGRTYPSGSGTCHDNPPRYNESANAF